MERKTILMISLLLILCGGIGVVFVIQPQKEREEKVYFDQVVIENGTDKMAGYFGYAINPDEREWYSNFYVRVLPSVDIHRLAIRANACEYETLLITEPPEHDPLEIRRVTVKYRIVLYPNNVSLWFNIIVLENGYLTVKVGSDYFLRDDWMRTVFMKMLSDIHLPLNTISQFELEVNWIFKLD